MQANALTARELFCRRGDRWLFTSLDLQLSAGAALHLVGPNGIGKTSLLRMLAGLLPPSSTGLPEGTARIGSVEWEGSVAMLDQRPTLDEHLPLGEALAFWTRLDGTAQPDLARLGLADLLDVPVRYLSTGQRKRAGLARLLSQQAGNWLLDEPFNGLDAAGVDMVRALIGEHRAGGGIVIIASHLAVDLLDMTVLDMAALPA